MVIIASLHLYANDTDSMEDSIEALHELMHFFYFKLAPIYGIVRDVIENTFLPWQCSKSTKVWNSEPYSSSSPQSSRSFNQHATEGQIQILMRRLISN